MWRTARVEGAVLVALGLIAVVEALRLRDNWQGAKLMPAVVGVALLVLGLAHFALRTERAAWPDAPSFRRVARVFVVLAAYVTILSDLGFLLATIGMVIVVVRTLGTFSWPVSAAYTLAIAGVSHVVFKHWLGMPLPAGPLGF